MEAPSILLHALLVDDFKDLLILMEKFLSRLAPDITVSTATSASIALDMMKETSYDIIVSDYQMPEMNGLEFLEHIRSNGDEIPFIIFTGRGREEVAIQALNLGATHYLKKGGGPESQYAELVHIMRTAVNHRRSQIALKESEQQHRTIIQSMTELIFVYDKDDFIRQIHASNKEILVKPIAESLDIHVSERMHQNFLDIYYDLSKKVRETGESQTFDMQYLIRGKEYWFTETLTLHEDGESIVNVVHEITDRKMAETQLLEAKILLSAIIEQSPIPTIVVSSNEEIILVNDACRRQMEMDENEDYGSGTTMDIVTTKQVVYDSKGDVVREANYFVRKALQGERISHEEIKIIRTDGSVRYEDLDAVPVYDPEGNIVAAYTVFPDITKRKIAEDELKKSETMFRTLADSMYEGILVINRDGTIGYTNPSFSTFWKISSEMLLQLDAQLLLEHILENVENSSKSEKLIQDIIRSNEGRYDRFQHKDGRVIETFSQPLFKSESNSRRIWIYKDVTNLEFRT